MKKILNWTIGSAFRTIGRFIGLLLISLIFGYLLIKSDIKITDLFGIGRVYADTTYSWTSKQSRIYYDNNGTENVYDWHNIPYTHSANYPITKMQYRLQYSGGLDSGNTYTFTISYTPNPDAINVQGISFSDSTGVITGVNCSGWSRNSSGKYSNTCAINPTRNISSSGYLYVMITYNAGYLTTLKSEVGSFSITKGVGAVIQDSAIDIMNNNNNNTNSIINNNNSNTESITNSIESMAEDIASTTTQNTLDMINNQNELMGNKCKNLFGGFGYTRTIDGATFTYNGDGTITINGTTTAMAYSMVSSGAILITLQAGTYTISGGTSNVRIQVVNSSGNVLSTTTSSTFSNSFTLSSETQVFVRVVADSGVTFSNKKIYVQLEKGSKSTTYCEYGSYSSKLDETTNSINNLNDTLTDDKVNDSDISNSLNFELTENAYGPFATFLTLPLQWVQDILSSNQVCRQLSLPLPFINRNLDLPCMTEFWNSLGALGTLIQLCWIAVVGVRIFNGLFVLVVDTTSSQDNAEELTKIRSWEL